MNRLNIFLWVLCCWAVQAQVDSSKGIAQEAFPQIKGYVGLVHPLYTFSSEGGQPNFRDYYIVGNPWGINIWKTKKFGVSFEFTPFLRVDDRSSKVSNVLFHPGCCIV